MLEDTLGLEAGAKYKIIIYKDITQDAKKIFRAVRQCELNFKSDLLMKAIIKLVKAVTELIRALAELIRVFKS